MISTPVSSSLPLLAKLFRGLAGLARLSCLLAVRDQERTVAQLVAAADLS